MAGAGDAPADVAGDSRSQEPAGDNRLSRPPRNTWPRPGSPGPTPCLVVSLVALLWLELQLDLVRAG